MKLRYLDFTSALGESASIADAAAMIVSPGKKLAGGWLYQGVPAKPVCEITRDEVAAIARSIRSGAVDDVVRSNGLPPMAALPEQGGGSASRHPRSRTSYVAPNAGVAGDVELQDDAGIYFGCLVDAHDGRIVIGARTNVQDNSFLITSKARGDL